MSLDILIKPQKFHLQILRIYTKTFGGKIWRNLHSVSPSNYFGKNLNKDSLEISRQNLCKQHLVQKN